jgi:oligoendopeptidase F
MYSQRTTTEECCYAIQLNRTIRYVAGAIVFVAGLAVAVLAQERDRSKIPEQYKWDLTALYPTDQAWRSQKENLVAELPKLREFQGKLGSSAQQLADALETQSRLEKELKRLSVYAGLISDQDTRVSTMTTTCFSMPLPLRRQQRYQRRCCPANRELPSAT